MSAGIHRNLSRQALLARWPFFIPFNRVRLGKDDELWKESPSILLGSRPHVRRIKPLRLHHDISWRSESDTLDSRLHPPSMATTYPGSLLLKHSEYRNIRERSLAHGSYHKR